MMKSPQKLNLRQMYNAFIQTDDSRAKHQYFADDLGIVIDAVNILSAFVFYERGPFLVEDYRFVICKKGTIRTIVNLQEVCIEQGMLAIIMPGSIIEPISVSNDFMVTGVGVSETRMRLAHQENLPEILCGQHKSVITRINENEQLLAEQLFATMWNLAKEKGIKSETVNSMLKVITNAFNDFFANHDINSNVTLNGHSRQHEILQSFITLVNEHCQSQRQLDFYASKLCITRRHLGTIIHQVSGITAKEWIDRAVITAAKVMLRHSSKSVAQISVEMNFPTDSFFCKYFKRLTGVTPLDWRNEATDSARISRQNDL